MICSGCGKCCWNWKENRPEEKCEYLAADMKTCTIHDRLIEVRPECVFFPEPYHIVDLPPECSFIPDWKNRNLLGSPPKWQMLFVKKEEGS